MANGIFEKFRFWSLSTSMTTAQFSILDAFGIGLPRHRGSWIRWDIGLIGTSASSEIVAFDHDAPRRRWKWKCFETDAQWRL